MRRSGRLRALAIMLGFISFMASIQPVSAASVLTQSVDSDDSLDSSDSDLAEGLRQDAQLLSDSTGRPVDEILEVNSIKERWRTATQDLGFGERNAGIYIVTEMPQSPDDPIVLHLKGPAPADITDALAKSGLKIAIRDGQPFSMAEFTEMQLDIASALQEVGYPVAASGVGVTDSRAVLQVSVPAETGPGWSRDQILDLIAKTVPDGAMNVIEVTTENVPIAEAADAYGKGGIESYIGDDLDCTTGWPIQHQSGWSGISGAGHCYYNNRIKDPANWYTGQYANIIPSGWHEGYYGDVAWWKINVSERTFFNSNSSNAQPWDVLDVEPIWQININDPICTFGRSQGQRTRSTPSCDTITQVNGSCYYQGANGASYNHYSMVYTTRTDNFIKGDSGGPAYWGYRAIGQNAAINCSVNAGLRNAISIVDRMDEAIGAKVLSRAQVVREQTITSGGEARSYGNQTKLVMQTDGNLVKYKRYGTSGWVANWSSSTFVPGSRVVMQGDGNFVVYSPSNTALWQSGTNQANSYIVVQDDGNAVIRNNGGTALWVG